MAWHSSKYRKGEDLKTFSDFLKWTLVDKKWVYLNDKPLHPEIVLNMTVNRVRTFLLSGALKQALPNKQAGVNP